VVWHSGLTNQSQTDVFGRRFDSAGAPLGTEFRVNASTEGFQSHARVAMKGSGEFVVVWSSGPTLPDDPAPDGDASGIFGRLFDASGTPLAPEFQVNSHTPDYQLRPAIAMGSSGEFAVVWQSYHQDGSFSGIFGQRFDSTGASQSSEFQVSSYTIEQQNYPSVAYTANAEFVVGWRSDHYQANGFSGALAQRFDALGARLGGEFELSAMTTAGQWEPAVSQDGDGFVAVWQGFDQYGSFALFGRRFDSSGVPRTPYDFRVDTSNRVVVAGPVAASTGDRMVIAWTDSLPTTPT
jgi:hypothetical protein